MVHVGTGQEAIDRPAQPGGIQPERCGMVVGRSVPAVLVAGNAQGEQPVGSIDEGGGGRRRGRSCR